MFFLWLLKFVILVTDIMYMFWFKMAIKLPSKTTRFIVLSCFLEEKTLEIFPTIIWNSTSVFDSVWQRRYSLLKWICE